MSEIYKLNIKGGSNKQSNKHKKNRIKLFDYTDSDDSISDSDSDSDSDYDTDSHDSFTITSSSEEIPLFSMPMYRYEDKDELADIWGWLMDQKVGYPRYQPKIETITRVNSSCLQLFLCATQG